MRRVHRNLSRDEVELLREQLATQVPRAAADIPSLLKTMRLIARKSQIEYASLCGVAPRVLSNIEAGKGSPTVETLEKLLRPFGYRIGVVAPPSDYGGMPTIPVPATLRRWTSGNIVDPGSQVVHHFVKNERIRATAASAHVERMISVLVQLQGRAFA